MFIAASSIPATESRRTPAFVPFRVVDAPHYAFQKPSGIQYRFLFRKQLEKVPGQHLVIVSYSPGHDVLKHEWVYNGAEIDSSRVVWARRIPGRDLQPLLDYFRGRQVWLAEPDASPPRLTSYPQPTPSPR